MTDIRQPDDWQVGDLAFCIEGGNLCAAGDIMRVTEVLPDNCVRFTDPYAVHRAIRFARILTSEEEDALPEGAVLYHVTAALRGYVSMGSQVTHAPGTHLPSIGMYALKSLPETKQEFKARDLKPGDWLRRIHVSTNSGSIRVDEEVEVETVVRNQHVYFKGYEHPFRDIGNFERVLESVKVEDESPTGEPVEAPPTSVEDVLHTAMQEAYDLGLKHSDELMDLSVKFYSQLGEARS